MQAQKKEAETPKVTVRKTIGAAPDAVFDAWTKPELMQQWFFPRNWSAKTSNTLRVGGSYSHRMLPTEGDSSCDGKSEKQDGAAKTHLLTGEYLEIKRPERLVFTWNSDTVHNTRVTVELRAVGNGTEVTITHELLETEAQRQQHAGGWEACLENLAKLLG